MGMVEFSQLDQSLITAAAGFALISISLFILVLRRGSSEVKNIPPGSHGLPVLGETLSFLQSQRDNEGCEWIKSRVARYGPVFKTKLFGSPTVVVTGKEGNKFVFTTGEDVLSAKQPSTVSKIVGKHNIFELTGTRYKLMKGAIMRFLRTENLQEYVGVMDDLVKTRLLSATKGRETIKVVPFMKDLAFQVACTLLFGIHDEPTKAALLEDFSAAFKAVWSVPINFPGTQCWQGGKARARIDQRMAPIIRKRREMLKSGEVSAESDVISSMLAVEDENGEPFTNEEIMDNIVTLVIASHDTSAILLSLMVWKMAQDPNLYRKVLEENMEILKDGPTSQEKLTWARVRKLKYTWRVAQELMRLIPPVFGSFRQAMKDTSFGGYTIPQGWKVFWAANTTHMAENIFSEPDEFDPSRFLHGSKPIPPFAYVPFGGGIHMCIGNEFARIETLTVVHHMVTSFEWSQLVPDEKITRQPMPYPEMGLPVKIKARIPNMWLD